MRITTPAVALAAAAALATAGTARANVPLTRVSADPFTNPTSQHATEVEPDTFAYGSTVVAAFQVGRFFNGGATDIGVRALRRRRRDLGRARLPAGHDVQLRAPRSPFERVSDASVAYDAAHTTWLISSIPLLPSTSVPTVLVSRSTDDGAHAGARRSRSRRRSPSAVDLDKNWTVCDNGARSPFCGHCYTELDNFGDGDRELMSTSTDGGLTWSVPIETAGHDKGLGGQPVVQPDGTVIVPFESLDGRSPRSPRTNGGASWTQGASRSSNDPLPRRRRQPAHQPAAERRDRRRRHGLRGLGGLPLPRSSCALNDIVFSKSADGMSWSDVARIPIDDVTSARRPLHPRPRRRPGHLGRRHAPRADVLLLSRRRLRRRPAGSQVGYISSPDGGAHWGAATQLAGPMALSQIARDLAGADGRRLHLDVVLRRPRRDGVRGRAISNRRQAPSTRRRTPRRPR